MIIARLPGRMGAGAKCGQAKPSKSSGQMILEAPGRAWNGSGSGARRLLLRELLPLHVGPDLLGHLRGPDRRGAHHGLEAVAAALEVDRITTERLLPFRHAPSSLRVIWPRVLGCAARRLPIRPRVLSRDHEGAQGKNTIPGGSPTRGKLPGGGIPPGGF